MNNIMGGGGGGARGRVLVVDEDDNRKLRIESVKKKIEKIMWCYW